MNREIFEDAFQHMMSNPEYVDLSFYSFVISKMKVEVTEKIPTAGAGFYNNVYNLLVNPTFFETLTLDQRLAILVHECQHVILQHVFRKGERDHKLFNTAADIAINQKIKNIPDSGMFPETFDFPLNLTTEDYYELLKEEKKQQEKEKAEYEKNQSEQCDNDGDSDGEDGEDGDEGGESGEGGDTTKGGWKPSSGHPDLTGTDEITIDSHELWDSLNSEDQELARDTMEKILEDAVSKSKGNTPQNISDLLELWKREPVISWKKILKKFISSKAGSKVGTIKKRYRRMPNRMDLKGKKTYYDVPEVIVGVDVSGSMSNEDIFEGLKEIHEICRVTGSNLKLVQIDTDIKGLETFDEKQKNFTRKGCGGTYMGDLPRYLLENKINCDVLVMISDMYIENVQTDENWIKFKKPVLWLNTSEYDMPVLKHHKVYDIKKA
jgi:predicted metal-dependent peptidase